MLFVITVAATVLLPAIAIFTTGLSRSGSENVAVMVSVSPDFTVLAEYVMVAVGAVLSNVTLAPPVTAVTCVPAFPALSVKSIVNGTTPVVSPVTMVYVAV